MYIHVYILVHEQITPRDAEKGKTKAAQHKSPETVIFKRKISCLVDRCTCTIKKLCLWGISFCAMYTCFCRQVGTK